MANNTDGIMPKPSPTVETIELSTQGWSNGRSLAAGGQHSERLLPSRPPHDEQQQSVRETTSRSRKSWIQSLDLGWTIEIGSCVLAITAFTSLIGLLLKFNNEPLPDLPRNITFNTLIAVITAILKASLMMPVAEGLSQAKWQWYNTPRPLSDLQMFDDASRGPWGALFLLLNFKRHYLGTFGALLTVLALAIDPFSQQVVQYRGCLQNGHDLQSTSAQIPVTTLYNLTGSVQIVNPPVPDPLMLAAIYMGLLSPRLNTSASLSAVCPSGNCTFPSTHGASYQSVAMCYKCQDITSLVLNNTQFLGYTNYTLPSSNISVVGNNVMSTTTIAYDAHPNLSTKYNATDHIDTLATIEALMFIPTDSKGDGVPFSTRCSLSPCVKTYSGNVSHNLLQEEEINSVLMSPVTIDKAYGLTPNETLRNGRWLSCFSTSNPTGNSTQMVQWGETSKNTGQPIVGNNTVTYYPRGCYWGYTATAQEDFATSVDQLFNDKALDTTWTLGQTMGDVWLSNLYQNGVSNMTWVNTYFKGLADSMTAHIRSHGAFGTEDWATGAVDVYQTCVYVRWAWLSLPGALLACAIAFLVATIRVCRAREPDRYGARTYRETGPLKSSALALLFHNMDWELQKATSHVVSAADMNAMAKDLNVLLRLSPETDHWVFTKVPTESGAKRRT